MLSHRNLMAMTVAHLADFDSPDENCSLVHGAPMSHGSGLYIPPYVLRGARQVIPESGAFEPDEFLDLCEHHPGCSAFLAPTMVQRLVQTGRARPRNLRTVVYGGGPMYVDSLKKAMAAFGPIFTQLYGQGEAPMTITGLAPSRPSDRRRRDPGLGRLRPIRGGRRGAARRRHTRRNRRDRRNRLPRRRCDVGLLEQSRRHRGHAAERLAAHRRHGFLRRARLPHLARPLEGRRHQRRQQHLPARSGGGADRAPGGVRGGGGGCTRRRVGRDRRRIHRRDGGPGRLGRSPARAHRALQATQALRVRRRAAEEQLRQGAQARAAKSVAGPEPLTHDRERDAKSHESGLGNAIPRMHARETRSVTAATST